MNILPIETCGGHDHISLSIGNYRCRCVEGLSRNSDVTTGFCSGRPLNIATSGFGTNTEGRCNLAMSVHLKTQSKNYGGGEES